MQFDSVDLVLQAKKQKSEEPNTVIKNPHLVNRDIDILMLYMDILMWNMDSLVLNWPNVYLQEVHQNLEFREGQACHLGPVNKYLWVKLEW